MSPQVTQATSDWQALAQVSTTLIWAVAAVIIALIVAPFVRSLLAQGRISRLSIGFVAIDLAAAREFEPSSPAMFLADLPPGYSLASYVPELMKQLEDRTPIDFIVVNLGDGQAWLSSRLHLFALLLQRMRALRVVVFVHHGERSAREFIGIADVGKLRWALARRYPHLEQAYAMAYGGWQGGQPPGLGSKDAAKVTRPNPQVVSNTGSMSRDAAFALVESYMAIIQRDHDPRQEAPTEKTKPWLELPRREGHEADPAVWEAADWLNARAIERLLGADLSHARVERSSAREQVAAVVREVGAFVALVDKNGRFEQLIDRGHLVDVQARALLE